MTPIGFGAFKIGRNQAAKYPGAFDLPDDRDVDVLLNGVLDLGINLIDTAPAYGLSEERIGRFLAHRRGEFILSTKVGEVFENGRSTYDFSAAAVRRSVEASLRRLRTDRLDLVYVHAPRDDVRAIEGTDVVEALRALQAAGCVSALGFSGHTQAGFRKALAWADALMVEYSVSAPGLAGVMSEAANDGRMVVVKKGLQSGHLEARSAIRFVLENRDVTSLLIGSLNLEHIREAVAAAAEVRKAEVPDNWRGPTRDLT